MGDGREALRWLDRAVDAQMWNWRLLAEHDRILEPLRDEPEFARIVARARREQERVAARWAEDGQTP
jgi:hypothetical protein